MLFAIDKDTLLACSGDEYIGASETGLTLKSRFYEAEGQAGVLVRVFLGRDPILLSQTLKTCSR